MADASFTVAPIVTVVMPVYNSEWSNEIWAQRSNADVGKDEISATRDRGHGAARN